MSRPLRSLFAALIIAVPLAPGVAKSAVVSAEDALVDDVARRAEGTHIAVRVEPPIAGIGLHGLTVLGVNASLRHDFWLAEGAVRIGTLFEDGSGATADLRVGTSLGYYGWAGGVRLNLTGGVAVTGWHHTHEYMGEKATLYGAGGEASLGYVTLGGVELRAALGLYSTLGGDFDPYASYDEAPPDRFGQLGFALGYEF